MDVCDLPVVRQLIERALAEDVGGGDITTRLTVPADRRARAEIAAKQRAIVAGLPLVSRVCAAVGGDITVVTHVTDGTPVTPGAVLATVSGPAASLLVAERLSLNFLQHLSGIATLTAQFVAAVHGHRCRIVDTRKTTPGLRVLEKYAVRVGGGYNHRTRLDDGILIKDNHITAAGGVRAAVVAARAGAPHGLRVEVECATLADVDEALAGGADAVLLDNMTVDTIAAAVHRIGGRALVEVSGGVNLDTVGAIAATGVDLISVGALTHSAPAVDIHMTLFLE